MRVKYGSKDFYAMSGYVQDTGENIGSYAGIYYRPEQQEHPVRYKVRIVCCLSCYGPSSTFHEYPPQLVLYAIRYMPVTMLA